MTLLETNPELCVELHPKNGLNPNQISCKLNKKIWWVCSKNPNHEWESTVWERTQRGRGCPFCAGKKVCIDDSLARIYPQISQEWHPDNELKPTEVLPGSHKKFNWLCPNGHKYTTAVYNRTLANQNCPYCSGKKVCKDNCLLTKNPKLCAEWHPDNELKPNEVTSGSGIKVKWQCKENHV